MQLTTVMANGRPTPRGRKVTIMMTLRELMNKVDDVSGVERVPSVVALLDTGSPVVASERMGDEIEVTAFRNGFVIYQNGVHATVFPVHKCKEYVEKDVMKTEHVLPFEAFADQPWQIRAFMEGEKRLVHNMNSRRQYANELSYDAYVDGWDMLSDDGEHDPLRLLIEEETSTEEKIRLYSILETLTEKQKYILFECVVNGRMQIDVANEMGTTRMNVTISLRKSLKKLREGFEIADRSFPRNHFYRPVD